MWIIAVSAMLFLMFAGSLAIAQRGRTGGGQDQREPISIGILLEASRNFESRMDAARDGIDLFLGTLEPDDEVFLMTVSDRPVLKHDFTVDRDAISEALASPILSFGPPTLHRSLVEALAKVEEGRHAKKVIVLVTACQISETDFAKSREVVRSSEALTYGLGMPFMNGSHEQAGYDPSAKDNRDYMTVPSLHPDRLHHVRMCERVLKAFAEDSGGAYGVIPIISDRLREYSVKPAFQAIGDHLANRD